MTKKILLGLIAVVAVAGGVAGMSAFEAHVINVTAKIENALAVTTEPIDFGTVFPQEYLEEEITISLSQSFLAEGNVDDVNYVIKQKPKPRLGLVSDIGLDAARAHCHANPEDERCYLSLCPYLSKMDGDPEDYNDTGIPSYFDVEGCIVPDPEAHAIGRLAKSQDDESDVWVIDLKVPPVAGYVGQDWPEGCPTLEANAQEYGCDLWIEVTHISRIPAPGEGNEVLSLENKDDQYWFVITDDTYGTLEFKPASDDFEWTLSVNGLQADTEYKLVYAPDPWPQGLPGDVSTLIGTFTTDGDGKWAGSGSTDLGYDLPYSAADENYPGAKIWVVLGNHHDGEKMIAWDHTEYLFEYNLITYTDTNK